MNIPYPGAPKYPPGDARNSEYFEKMRRENWWIAKSERSFWTGMSIGILLSVGIYVLAVFAT
jgi:hypothetical protein